MAESCEVAVVTGAARGIGRAVAVALTDAGFRVLVADIDAAAGRATLEALRGGPALHAFVQADLRVVAELFRVVDIAADRFGRIDVLVNNAAVTRPIDFFELAEDDWDSIFDLNAKACFFGMQAVARRMTAGGRIVNLGSIAGKGWRETSNIAYAGSKGAVIAMTRIAAAALGPAGIRVNAVCPGMTTTEMMQDWLGDRAAALGVPVQSLLQDLTGQVPLRVLNEPEDVAAAVLFLAGAGSRTITGQSLNVDGGIVFD